jgi:hypothetical protein
MNSSRESACTPISTIHICIICMKNSSQYHCLFYFTQFTVICKYRKLRSCISKGCVHGGLINIHETLLGLSCTTQDTLLHFNSRKNHSLFDNTPLLSGHTTCINTFYFLTISVCGVTVFYTVIYFSRTQ